MCINKLIHFQARFDKVVCTSIVNGKEAVKACEAKMFDVILMDLYMPVLNGIDASREILNISRYEKRKKNINDKEKVNDNNNIIGQDEESQLLLL